MTVSLLRIDLRAPHQVYKNAAGQKVEGVTTVLRVLAKEALLGWYADMERQAIRDGLTRGASVKEMFPETLDGKPIWHATRKRDQAADVGSIGHAHIEAFLKGTTLDPDGIDSDLYKQALTCRDRFVEWWTKDALSLMYSEHQMVSEMFQIGGTADCLACDSHGDLVLWDIKSSKPFFDGYPYPEFYAQTAAYSFFFEETTGKQIAHIKIARTGKTPGDKGDLYTVTPEQRAAGLDLFRAAAAAYHAKRKLTQLCK